jgi:hypothetical protein
VGPAGQVRGRDDDNIGVRVEDDEPILGKPVAESREAQQAAFDVMSQVGVCCGVGVNIDGSVLGERSRTSGSSSGSGRSSGVQPTAGCRACNQRSTA